jgi:hypothetical protein
VLVAVTAVKGPVPARVDSSRSIVISSNGAAEWFPLFRPYLWISAAMGASKCA